jgi:short-subunit dehydrogenase
MNTEGKSALVTGASRGLGLEVARLLAQQGCRVTIAGRHAGTLDDALRSLHGQGHSSRVFDLSRREDTHALLQLMHDAPFDVVVNNAGGTRFGRFSDLPADIVEEIAWLNFTAPALISRQFLRTAPADATLVNVTSIVATVPMPGNTLYSAAKAGVRALSEGLWFEARQRGLRVIEFRPVSLRTQFHEHAGQPALTDARNALDPAEAARQLVRILADARGLSYGSGLTGRIISVMNRVLPRSTMVNLLGRRATRSGYLS